MNTPLPIVKVPYAPYNPDFRAKYGEDAMCSNMGEMRLSVRLLDAEVLTLHLNTGKMRVRFVEPQFNWSRGKDEVVSIDVDISHFFTQYSLVKA